MRKTIGTTLFVYVFAALIIGCGQQGGGGNGGGNTPEPPPLTCPVGYRLAADGKHCYIPAAPPAYDNNPRVFELAIGNSNQATRPSSTDAMKRFLKEAMHICDRTKPFLGIGGNIGIASCDAWTSGVLYITIDAKPNDTKAKVTFTAYPEMTWINGGFGIHNTVGVARNPMQITLNITNYNNSKGFQIYGRGLNDTEAYNDDIQLIVREGKLIDNRLEVEFKFAGQTVGTATAERIY